MKQLISILCILFCVLSCEHITEVQDISKETITILAPKNEAVSTTNDVDFSWEAIEEVTNYKFQIAQPNFENASKILEDSIVEATKFSKILEAGNYQWRVRGENSEYQTTYTISSFTVNADNVIDISNSQVVLSTPNNDVKVEADDTVNFSWQSIEGAANYVIQVATPDFDDSTNTVKDEAITATSFRLQICLWEIINGGLRQ